MTRNRNDRAWTHPTGSLDPAQGLAARIGQRALGAVLHAQGGALAEVALVDLLASRVFERRCLRACHGAQTAIGAEQVVDPDDSVIALFDGPRGAGLEAQRPAAVLAQDGEVFPDLLVGEDPDAGGSRGDLRYVSRRADHLAGPAARAFGRIEEDIFVPSRHEPVGELLFLRHAGPQVFEFQLRFSLSGCFHLSGLSSLFGLFGHSV